LLLVLLLLMLRLLLHVIVLLVSAINGCCRIGTGAQKTFPKEGKAQQTVSCHCQLATAEARAATAEG